MPRNIKSLYAIYLCALQGEGIEDFCGEYKPAESEEVHFISVASPNKDVSTSDYFNRLVLNICNLVKKNKDRAIFIQVVFNPLQEENFRGVAALFHSLKQEYSRFSGQVIEIGEDITKTGLYKVLKENRISKDSRIEVAYRKGKRYALKWIEKSLSPNDRKPWQPGHVYLVTGGLGGIGKIIVEDMIACQLPKTIIISGRRSGDAAIEEKIDRYKSPNITVEYRTLDVSEFEQVDLAVRSIIENYRRLDGIFHCAGVTMDKPLSGKTDSEILSVLSPKVKGLYNLDYATQSLKLSYFVLFSSISSVNGNAGQVDYSSGNGFMDGFSFRRNRLASQGGRYGKTVSVNWPYWKEGGMKIEDKRIALTKEISGMTPLSSSLGLKCLYHAMLSTEEGQLAVISGEYQILRDFLHDSSGESIKFQLESNQVKPLTETDSEVSEIDHERVNKSSFSGELMNNLGQYLSGVISGQVGVAKEKISWKKNFNEYGMDSIMTVNAIVEMETVFGSLPKILLIENQNVEELLNYLYTHKKNVVEHEFSESSEWNGREATAVREIAEQTDTKEYRPVELTSNSTLVSAPKDERNEENETSVAIVGVAGRYPGSGDIEEFWQNLCSGFDGITTVPKERWDASTYFSDTGELGKTRCKWGGFLDNVDYFDPLFFGFTPIEAGIIDPNERLILETVQHLMDSMGLTRKRIQSRFNNRVGVFIGAMYQQYPAFKSDIVSESIALISSYSSMANRISHTFNINGPSLAIDTMCSSSMVALHSAWQSIRANDCRAAIVGGVNLSLHPKKYIGLSASGMLSGSRKSRSFSKGDGYLPSEGVGAVFLRPLQDAINDGDTVLAKILSVHVNHNGGSNSFAMPNIKAQTNLTTESFDKAGVGVDTISYIESASNGIQIADSTEISVLKGVFDNTQAVKTECTIGSVKSNIGHAEAASGIAQLTKVLLQLKHKKIVPTPEIGEINGDIDFSSGPLKISYELRDWDQPTKQHEDGAQTIPRRAAINCFGAGGTNAVCILEEHYKDSIDKVLHNSGALESEELFIYSARSSQSLAMLLDAHIALLSSKTNFSLQDYAKALRHGREQYQYRLAVISNKKKTLISSLTKSKVRAAPMLGARIFRSVDTELGDRVENLDNLSDIDLYMREKNWSKLAELWINDEEIDWDGLNENGKLTGVETNLPLYPFDHQSCWISQDIAVDDVIELDKETHLEKIMLIFSTLSGIPKSELSETRPLSEYGMSSAIFLQFHRQLNSQFGEISLEALRGCQTFLEVCKNARPISNSVNEQSSRLIDHTTQVILNPVRYPELIALNTGNEGRPIFWIHAGIGGVEAYQVLGRITNRPLFGIQARGYMTDRQPLTGLQAMAGYYCHLILIHQNTGPISIGGYSLGGALAYEVARQLQEIGHTVEDLVLIDTLDSDAIAGSSSISRKSLYLQGANVAVASSSEQNRDIAMTKMVHRDSLDETLTDEMYLAALANRIHAAKPSTPLDVLESQIKANASVQNAYDAGNFSIAPMPRPEELTSVYFRNKNKSYFGELEPYLLVSEDTTSLGKSEYWRGWTTALPDIKIVDVDAISHMLLLSSEPSIGQITSHLEKLYNTTPSVDDSRLHKENNDSNLSRIESSERETSRC